MRISCQKNPDDSSELGECLNMKDYSQQLHTNLMEIRMGPTEPQYGIKAYQMIRDNCQEYKRPETPSIDDSLLDQLKSALVTDDYVKAGQAMET